MTVFSHLNFPSEDIIRMYGNQLAAVITTGRTMALFVIDSITLNEI